KNAKVFDFVWTGDFAAARNFSLAQASGEWILVLDADEAIDEQDLPAFVELTSDRKICTEFFQRHYTDDHRLNGFQPAKREFPQWERNYAGYFESPCVRLFPNGADLRFQGRIHELVEHSIRQGGLHRIVR